jgi:hypothetical protein
MRRMISMASKDKPGWDSRKYRTAWYLTALSTGILIVPLFIDKEIITGYQYLTFLFGIWGIYFGANVAEKANIFKDKPSRDNYSQYDSPEEGE